MQSGDTHKENALIVVDLGSASRKCIRKLKRGKGRLEAEVQEAIMQLRTELGADAENKELVPIMTSPTKLNACSF